MPTTSGAPASFEEFWPFYVAQHAHPGTRAWHLAGTSFGILALAALPWGPPLLLLATALVLGYGCAWIGHFFVEHNQPATFRHPLWSFRGDLRMYRLMLQGRMSAEVERLHVSRPTSLSEGVTR